MGKKGEEKEKKKSEPNVWRLPCTHENQKNWLWTELKPPSAYSKAGSPFAFFLLLVFYFSRIFSSLGELETRTVCRCGVCGAALPSPRAQCVCVRACLAACVCLSPLTANFRHFGPAEWRAPRPRLGGVSCGCRPPQPSQPPASSPVKTIFFFFIKRAECFRLYFTFNKCFYFSLCVCDLAFSFKIQFERKEKNITNYFSKKKKVQSAHFPPTAHTNTHSDKHTHVVYPEQLNWPARFVSHQRPTWVCVTYYYLSLSL